MRLVLAALFICVFLPFAASMDAIVNIDGSFESEEPHEVMFLNQSDVTESKLMIKSPQESQMEVNMTSKNNKLSYNISGEFLDNKGVYNYHFVHDDVRYPSEGHFSLKIGEGNNEILNEFENLADNRPQDSPHCSDEDDFACEIEHYQASMMLKAVSAYDITGDDLYREEAINFSVKPYGSPTDREIACRHEENSFDCFSGADDPTGPIRQGSLINGLWSVYSSIDNSSLRELAINYTEEEFGNDNCDVWNDKYDCGTAKETAYLANGFWKAYEVTSDQDYRLIAENLTAHNLTHPAMVEANAIGYRLTENKSYLEATEKMFDSEFQRCEQNDDCTTLERLELAKAGIAAYSATGQQGFYAGGLKVRPESCENGICDNPNLQGFSTVAASKAYMSFKNEEPQFYNPRIIENPSGDGSLEVGVEFRGVLNNPEILLNSLEGDILNSCDLRLGNLSCTFDHEWQGQQVYYVNFSSDELSYPDGRGLPVTYTQIDSDIMADALQVAQGSPDSQCNPYEEDYSCVSIDFDPYELDQASYISGFSTSYSYTGNETYRTFSELLSSPPYHYEQNATEDDEDLCIPDNNLDGDEYRCDTFDDVGAGQRQGSLIEALYSSYSITANMSTLNLAENYAMSSVRDDSDCDVWSGDFDCRVEDDFESQSHMIDGYWTAYKVTGNNTYRDIAVNLTEEGLNQEEGYNLAGSIWKTYRMTGNEAYRNSATNMTANLSSNESCGEECGLEKYIEYGNMLLDAYKASGNDTYVFEGLENHLQNRTDYDCLVGGDCDSPSLQGEATSFLMKSAHNMPLSVGLERDLEVSKEEITVGDSVEVTCHAENVLENSTVFGLSLTVSSSIELGNESIDYNIGDLEYNETNTTVNEFASTEPGTAEVMCDYTSTEINRTSIQDIEIQPEEDDSDDSGGDDDADDSEDSGSSDDSEDLAPPGGEVEDDRAETVNYSFEYREYNITELGLNESYENYKIYSDSCIDASRSFEDEYTSLNINQSCKEDVNLAVRDWFNGSNQDEVFYDIGSEELEVSYSFESDESDWTKPHIAIFYEEDLEIRSEIADNVNTSNSYYVFDVQLNRAEECTVFRNESMVSQNSSETQVHNVSLTEGTNRISVECDSVSQAFIVDYEEEQESRLSSFLLIIGLGGIPLTISGLAALYHRQRIISFAKIKVFDFYFDRVTAAVEKGDTDAALNNYRKMSKYCNFPGQETDSSAREGLKLYMMIDLVSDAGTDLSDAELLGDVKTSLGQYLSKNPESPLARHIRSKIKSI